jgi:hypothetical protein
MGRMKELYMQVYQANDGIPEEMTVGDIIKMKELQIFEWNAYEREKERERLQQLESENSGEAAKILEVEQEFEKYFKEAKREQRKNNKQ